MLAVLGVVVSVGTAGVPGAATVAAATVLSAAGLPLEFVAATIPIGVIADMARTATNVTAAAVSATVVARQTGLLDDEIFAGRAEFVDEDELRSRGRRRVPAPARVPVIPTSRTCRSAAVPTRWPRSAAADRAAVVARRCVGAACRRAPPRCQGVTNPADHPAPITVTIDGQTYHDGLDTLPGYDDYACTPIPNVQYDFATTRSSTTTATATCSRPRTGPSGRGSAPTRPGRRSSSRAADRRPRRPRARHARPRRPRARDDDEPVDDERHRDEPVDHHEPATRARRRARTTPRRPRPRRPSARPRSAHRPPRRPASASPTPGPTTQTAATVSPTRAASHEGRRAATRRRRDRPHRRGDAARTAAAAGTAAPTAVQRAAPRRPCPAPRAGPSATRARRPPRSSSWRARRLGHRRRLTPVSPASGSWRRCSALAGFGLLFRWRRPAPGRSGAALAAPVTPP